MALLNDREFWNPDRLRPAVDHGILNRFISGDTALEIEVDRAPDSGGSPGTYATVARVGPFPRSGGWYFDPRPNDNLTYWYRARHVGSGVTAGAYTTAVSGVPRRFDDPALTAQLTAPPSYVQTADINADAVTAAEIVAGAVGTTELANDAVTNPKIADDAVDTAQLVAAAVTPAEAQARGRCKVSATLDQTLTTAVAAILNWDAEQYDSGSLHDNATNNSRITIPAGGNVGLWMFIARVTFAANATGVRIVRIQKNGTTNVASVLLGSAGGANATSLECTVVEDAPAVGDYFTVEAYQNSGGNLNAIMDTTNYSESTFQAVHLW